MACVLSTMAITILILYSWLDACAFLRFRKGQRLISTAFHRVMHALFGLRISANGIPSSNRPLIVVANHTSWLDIVIIASFLPAVFVALHEVALDGIKAASLSSADEAGQWRSTCTHAEFLRKKIVAIGETSGRAAPGKWPLTMALTYRGTVRNNLRRVLS